MKKTIYYVGIFLIGILCLSACGSKESSWVTTKNEVKIWYEKSDFFNDYIWKGPVVLGYAHGEGTLLTVNSKGNTKSSKPAKAIYGLIKPSDRIKIDYDENSSCYYWGQMDDDKIKGDGVMCFSDSTYVLGSFNKFNSDSVTMADAHGHIIYIGGWKRNKFHRDGILYDRNQHLVYDGHFKKNLYHGQGIKYFTNGNIQYRGSWKYGTYHGKGEEYNEDGTIKFRGGYNYGRYHGFGTLYTSSHDSIQHHWTEGKPTRFFQNYYTKLERNKGKYDSTQYSHALAHLVWFEHYGWIVIICALVLFFLLLRIFFATYTKCGDELYWYTQPDIIKKSPFYLWWLFLGFCGMHRFRLGSLWGVVPLLCGSIIYLCNFIDILALGSAYRLDIITQTPAIWYTTCGCLAIIGLMWLFDAFWIGYRVYYLNAKYYRYDCREEQMRQQQPTDIDDLLEDVRTNVPMVINKIKKINLNVTTISKEKVKHDFAIGKFLKWGEKEHLETQNKKVIETINNAQQWVYTLQKYCSCELSYLEEARVVAYRNLNLAKEIISVVRDINSHQQVIQTDSITSASTVSISTIDPSRLKVEANFDNFKKNQETISELLQAFGTKESTSQNIGVGIASIIEIENVIYQQRQAMKAIALNINDNVQNMKQILEEAMIMQAELLRMNEIIEALYNANIAFVQAYSPLRDKIFGEPSIKQYLLGIDKKTPYLQSDNFKRDIVHLQSVGSQYNRINKSKII